MRSEKLDRPFLITAFVETAQEEMRVIRHQAEYGTDQVFSSHRMAEQFADQGIVKVIQPSGLAMVDRHDPMNPLPSLIMRTVKPSQSSGMLVWVVGHRVQPEFRIA